MGATSVTGVGVGSVEGQNKGSKHWTVGTNRLIGPRVMAAGQATLSSGTKTVTLPALPTGSYLVVCTDASGTAAATSGTLANTAGTSCVLTLKGTSSNTVNWVIVKIGDVSVG